MANVLQVISSIVYALSLYIIIAFPFLDIYLAIRFFHVAHAVSLTLAAYMVYTASVLWGVSLWLAVPLAIAVVVLLMLGINQWVYHPLKRQGLESWQMMIASLGLYVVLQNVISMIWGDSTLSFRTWEIKVGHEFMGAYITDVQIITIVSSVILLLLSHLFMERTHIGRQIKAVASNPELSRVLGISETKAIAWSVGIGTGLAACAGILIAADIDMTPTMGFNWFLYGVVAMIIGGMGRMRYLLLGALLLATAQHLSAYYIDSKWMNATAYVILIVFLYFRPYGFSGKQLKKAEI
ncbi:branched-chain amino acid ABC transporter permease [Porphyromonas gingivalis]|uniref:Probable ABC transporter membrane protein n=1 Tax=Porphyromonas gingivalis (strain ATCC 33277 / DSM 20709 / CIP 103683 / JCM 12257 / NCTC 11834 / 2561) TaxID=431947 RepID=B2RKE9_PORG3|nr:branched-chain amino acid ABC transporter permease [Porphyromonas gingivalis]AIJ35574.1 ABC transporter permease [Porphyromonas gingivalis]ALJ25765.1 branched-chain amino acid ABC-type transport system, permease component [Porphyromonas gingivalis 381]AUR49926.1 high-affinity branched-chain amino acid transport system permease protein LivH [Porphyromonas gingivalis ATCC 33277]MDR4975121.1 branched-chain amino acid ABC transporter permease [Porphyromonas gingivalis]SJL20015.1 High-affinity b